MNTWYLPYSNNKIHSPDLAFDIAFKKHFDFTAGNNKDWIKKTEDEIAENGDVNAFGLAVGMSSVIALAPIQFLENKGYEPATAKVGIMPEFGLSYYSAKKELVYRMAYRPTTRFVRNDDFAYLLKDKRLSIEILKFLFDYQGFMPFVGLSLNNSFYDLTINSSSEQNISESGNNQSASFVFGWDIRPTQAEWFVLRTTLRYQPRRGYNQYAQDRFSRDLEFNFIQIVVYPQRFKYYFR